MIPPAVAQHPVVRVMTATLIVGDMALAVLRWFMPERGPNARRWYD